MEAGAEPMQRGCWGVKAENGTAGAIFWVGAQVVIHPAGETRPEGYWAVSTSPYRDCFKSIYSQTCQAVPYKYKCCFFVQKMKHSHFPSLTGCTGWRAYPAERLPIMPTRETIRLKWTDSELGQREVELMGAMRQKIGRRERLRVRKKERKKERKP